MIWLVVEPPTPLKNDGVKVSWDYELHNIWKNKVNYRYFKTYFKLRKYFKIHIKTTFWAMFLGYVLNWDLWTYSSSQGHFKPSIWRGFNDLMKWMRWTAVNPLHFLVGKTSAEFSSWKTKTMLNMSISKTADSVCFWGIFRWIKSPMALPSGKHT